MMKENLKMMSLLLLSAVISFSCSEKGDDNVGMDDEFVVSFDKNVISSDGTDCVTLTAALKGQDVTSETNFFVGEDMAPLAGNVFSTDKVGEYRIYASHLTFITDDPIIIKAINVAIPAAAADPSPEKTTFVHRSFLNQYTGTGCGYCPGMIRALRSALQDEETASMAVLAAVHSFGAGDPAYIPGPRANSYPYLQIDMTDDFTYDLDPLAERGVLKNKLKARTSEPAKVGISANANYENDILVTRVAVKAAEAGEYNVGVWFMQDNVYGLQKDDIGIVNSDKTYYNHDNCVRSVDSIWGNTYVGYPLGAMEAGETEEMTFVLNVNRTLWKLNDLNDLHFAVFVTTSTLDSKGNRRYSVVNVIDCPYIGETPFEYR